VRLTAARVVVFSLLAALVVFAVVQDRVTAAGARHYVVLHTAAGGSSVTLDEVMKPAIRASVLSGLRWSGIVASVGFVCAGIVSRRNRRA